MSQFFDESASSGGSSPRTGTNGGSTPKSNDSVSSFVRVRSNESHSLSRSNSLNSLRVVALEETEEQKFQSLLKGLVQVFTASTDPSFEQPWTKTTPTRSTGSGFIVDVKNRLILTNAHCVTHARTIEIRKEGDFDKFEARILSIAHQVDIAILTIDDDKFWDGAEVIVFGSLPRMHQHVDVIGYPTGGDTVCITSGVVSRIDWTSYAQSFEINLCVQIDAAINPGNSGGPALSDGKMIGIAFQGQASAENIGYIIPVVVVKRCLCDFLTSIDKMGIKLCAPIFPICEEFTSSTRVFADEVTKWPKSKSSGEAVITVGGFARFPVSFQEAENLYLRRSVGLPTNESGVVMKNIPKVSNLHGKIQPNDVLVAIDGITISNVGNISRPPLPQMDFRSIISLKMVGEPLTLEFYRKGEDGTAQRHKIETVAENPPRLCPYVDYGSYTQFVMWGGLVFAPYAHTSLIDGNRQYGGHYSSNCQTNLKHKGKEFDNPDMQAVVLCSMLPHKVSIGYSMGALNLKVMPLYKINGKEVNTLYDVAEIICAAKVDGSELIEFEFCNDNCVVLPLKEGMEATAEIQKDFGMAMPYSINIDTKLKESNKSFY